jgi:hypothetical protein
VQKERKAAFFFFAWALAVCEAAGRAKGGENSRDEGGSDQDVRRVQTGWRGGRGRRGRHGSRPPAARLRAPTLRVPTLHPFAPMMMMLFIGTRFSNLYTAVDTPA